MTEKKKYDNSPKVAHRFRTVKKDGKVWFVSETVISRWYPEAYFEAMLKGDSTGEEESSSDSSFSSSEVKA